MNRRSFLRLIGLGAIAAPVVAKGLLTPEPEKAFSNGTEFCIGDKKLPNAYKIAGIREDLTDFLTILESEDTPRLAMFHKKPAYEWGPGARIPVRNSNDYLYNTS